MPEPRDFQYCVKLVEQLLLKKAAEAGHTNERMRLAHNRGYLTGILARLAVEDYGLQRKLKKLIDR